MENTVAAERFRRDELVWSLTRLTDLINVSRVPMPARAAGPLVVEFTVPVDGVNQAAEEIGRTPQWFKGQYFVTLDGEELRVRWSASAPEDPTAQVDNGERKPLFGEGEPRCGAHTPGGPCVLFPGHGVLCSPEPVSEAE